MGSLEERCIDTYCRQAQVDLQTLQRRSFFVNP